MSVWKISGSSLITLEIYFLVFGVRLVGEPTQREVIDGLKSLTVLSFNVLYFVIVSSVSHLNFFLLIKFNYSENIYNSVLYIFW